MQKQITNDAEGPSAKYQQFFAACVGKKCEGVVNSIPI